MMRMLVTRPEPDAQATRERLDALGIAADCAPLMTRQTLEFRLPAPEGFAALAVTSTNALRALAEGDYLAPFIDKPLFAVGDRTAHEARALGFTHVTAADGTLPALVTALARARLEGPVLYPSGKHRSGDMAHALAPHGLMVVTVPVYDMVAETSLPAAIGNDLRAGAFGAVLVYSQRTAEIFCTLADPLVALDRRRALPVLCLSEQVAAPLVRQHFSRVLLADHPSEEAMMTLALAFEREQTGP